MSSYSVVVAGGTGACGRDVLAQLLASGRCTKVTALVRSRASAERRVETTSSGAPIPADARTAKLVLAEVDWENFVAQGPEGATASEVIRGHDYAINCLGTTRKDAGSAASWLRVDRDYYGAFADACKAQGVPQYSQVSSAGASKGNLFMYPRTKGQMDDHAGALGFDRVWIFRPGLLERGDVSRGVEKFGKMIGRLVGMPGLPVSTVAAAAVNAYERQIGGEVNIVGEREMKREYA